MFYICITKPKNYEVSIKICITNIDYRVHCNTRIHCVCYLGVENSRHRDIQVVSSVNKKIYVGNGRKVSTQSETTDFLIG